MTSTPKFAPTSFAAPSSVPSTVAAHTSAGGAPLTVAPTLIAPSASESPYTVRGGAKTVEHGGHVEIHDTPINHEHGGEGNGRFPEHPPFQVPPGHDPDHQDHHGRPSFVDYTKPRHF
jgi:hypothetical protein